MKISTYVIHEDTDDEITVCGGKTEIEARIKLLYALHNIDKEHAALKWTHSGIIKAGSTYRIQQIGRLLSKAGISSMINKCLVDAVVTYQEIEI